MRSMFDPHRRSVVAARCRVADLLQGERRYHHPDFDKKGLEGWRAVHREAALPQAAWKAEQERSVGMGLPGAASIEDRSISTFARGELPHYAGINTFLKAPYVENVRDAGKYDAAILGAPFDGGTTFRPGTRFGPQAIRRISALYTPYNFEIGVDLREQMTLCDLGDVFTIPANLEKTFDQISRAVAHVFSQGALPIILGGDHSIGFPTVRGIAQCTSRRIGIIHFDRHADIQEKDLDERMHTTPWFHATNLPNVPASNLVQIGIGGWQVPREAVAMARERDATIITMSDVEKLGVAKVAEIALEIAWKDADTVYMSFDIDSVDCGFVPGTGWPEPGGFLPREALGLVGRVAKEGFVEWRSSKSRRPPTPRTSPRSSRPASSSTLSARSSGMGSSVRIRPSSTSRWRSEMRSEALGPGHNTGPRAASQWQAPKAEEGREPRSPEPDIDLVELEFHRLALTSTDPISLLRLARVPFVADFGNGKLMRLLRVSVSDEIEVGAISPGYGGMDVVYHPVPASRVQHSRGLRFVYHTPDGIRAFTYAEIRDLPDLA